MPNFSFRRSLIAVALAVLALPVSATHLSGHAADAPNAAAPAATEPAAAPAASKGAGPKAKDAKPGDAPAAKEAVPGKLAPFAWLEGCWKGTVNEREYVEHWLPLRGNVLLGVSHTVRGAKTQDYEYLRIESRADGIFYVDQPNGRKDKESAFKFVDRVIDTSDGRSDEVYTFAAATQEFPQKIVYRRGSEGWLYPQVEGKLNGADKKVIYPMRRIDCQNGEFIRK